MSCCRVPMDEVLSRRPVEELYRRPIRLGRLVGGGGAAHALERGSQSGALGTVVLGMRPRLAHRLLGGLDSRH